jgi:hypothetical protein
MMRHLRVPGALRCRVHRGRVFLLTTATAPFVGLSCLSWGKRRVDRARVLCGVAVNQGAMLAAARSPAWSRAGPGYPSPSGQITACAANGLAGGTAPETWPRACLDQTLGVANWARRVDLRPARASRQTANQAPLDEMAHAARHRSAAPPQNPAVFPPARAISLLLDRLPSKAQQFYHRAPNR